MFRGSSPSQFIKPHPNQFIKPLLIAQVNVADATANDVNLPSSQNLAEAGVESRIDTKVKDRSSMTLIMVCRSFRSIACNIVLAGQACQRFWCWHPTLYYTPSNVSLGNCADLVVSGAANAGMSLMTTMSWLQFPPFRFFGRLGLPIP